MSAQKEIQRQKEEREAQELADKEYRKIYGTAFKARPAPRILTQKAKTQKTHKAVTAFKPFNLSTSNKQQLEAVRARFLSPHISNPAPEDPTSKVVVMVKLKPVVEEEASENPSIDKENET